MRVLRILSRHAALKMDFGRKLLLGAAAVTAVAMPLAFGLVNALQSPGAGEQRSG